MSEGNYNDFMFHVILIFIINGRTVMYPLLSLPVFYIHQNGM